MRYNVLLISIFLAFGLFNQMQAQTQEPMLLGEIKRADLLQEPYNKWFESGYASYEPDLLTMDELKKINLKDYSFQLFMATWCGDTQRELPRFMKIMDALNVKADKMEIVALNSGKGVHKQSPEGQEKGKCILRVATFIILKNGKEINRIVEFPVTSLERDLLSILKGEAYSPNYRSYPSIISWLNNGLLTDKNVSLIGLAEQIRFKAKNAGELTSAAYVLLNRDQTEDASKLCQIAYYLFPDANHYGFYAEVFHANAEDKDALFMIQKALAVSKTEQQTDELVKLYKTIKN